MLCLDTSSEGAIKQNIDDNSHSSTKSKMCSLSVCKCNHNLKAKCMLCVSVDSSGVVAFGAFVSRMKETDLRVDSVRQSVSQSVSQWPAIRWTFYHQDREETLASIKRCWCCCCSSSRDESKPKKCSLQVAFNVESWGESSLSCSFYLL